MPWMVGGAILGSALLSSSASSKASKGQVGAANAANAEQARQYDQSRSDLEPWRTAGGAAIDSLSNRLGLTRGPAEATMGHIARSDFDVDAYLAANPDVAKDSATYGNDPYDHYIKFGMGEGRQGFKIGALTQGEGDLMRKFRLSDFESDPVNQIQGTFALDEARKAIERRASARGGWDSGATLKALTRYGSDYGNQRAGESYNRFVGDQTNQFNRLASVAGFGQTAANQTATLGANTATNIGNNTMQAANARGSGYIGQANAITGGVGTGLNFYQNQQFLNRLQPSMPAPPAQSWNMTGDFPEPSQFMNS